MSRFAPARTRTFRVVNRSGRPVTDARSTVRRAFSRARAEGFLRARASHLASGGPVDPRPGRSYLDACSDGAAVGGVVGWSAFGSGLAGFRGVTSISFSEPRARLKFLI